MSKEAIKFTRRDFLMLISGLALTAVGLGASECEGDGGDRKEPLEGVDAIEDARKKGECPENPAQFINLPDCPTAQPFPTPRGGW